MGIPRAWDPGRPGGRAPARTGEGKGGLCSIPAQPGLPPGTHSPWRRLLGLRVPLRLHSAPREATLPAAQPATGCSTSAERHVSDSTGMSGAGRSRDRVQPVGRFRFLPRAESWPTRRAASAETSTPSMQRGPRSLSGRGCSAGGVGPRRAARGTPGLGVCG